MADVLVNKSKAEYEWILQRGASTATRTFSVDGVPYTEGGKSAAVAFRDIFTGGASNPLSVVDPTKFWQPTGWRDSDLTEDEWTTVGCNLTLVKTDEWQIDGGGGGGGGALNLQLQYDSGMGIRIDFNGSSDSGGTRKVFAANQSGQALTVSWDSSDHYYLIEASELAAATLVTVAVMATLDSPTESSTIEISE